VVDGFPTNSIHPRLCFADPVADHFERYVEVNGVRLRVTEAGERGAPVVLLVHGFPDLAYAWRRQVPVLADAGYHVIAPDQRGYGGSSRPDAVTDYDIVALTDDLVGLLDSEVGGGAETAVVVGHDWGAIVAWHLPLRYPDRVTAVAGLSMPPVPRPRRPPTVALRRTFGEHFFYMLHFQQPGVADAEMDRDPATTLRRIMASTDPSDRAAAARMHAPGPQGFIDRIPEPGGLPPWISDSEFDHYVEEFTRTGFTGPLNWYRNLDRNWELTASLPTATITVPALFVGGSADPALMVNRPSRAREVATGDYREVMVDGAGHWLQQERPDEVNAALLEFLSATAPHL
jgi:pimeloyl-ACP methyl ester carboxylesterase